MPRVTAYEAADGSLFRDKKAYLRHEANLLVAKELRGVIDGALAPDSDTAARQATIENIHDFIVNGIGLNTMRDLFALQFKPGADDGDDTPASTAGAQAEAQAPAAGTADATATGADI